MLTESQVTEYIEGSLDEDDEQMERTLVGGDPDLMSAERFAEILLTRGRTRMLQQVLAAEGPSLIPVILAAAHQSIKGATHQNIKDAGKGLSDAVVQMARKVDRRMVHTERLVKAIAIRSRDWGTQVGARLVQAMSDHDPDIRALAVLLCGVDGIPPRSYGQQVVERFELDRDELVRVTAAICMATVPDAPQGVFQESVDMVMMMLADAEQVFPDLLEQVRRELRNKDEGLQNLMITKAAAYRAIAFR